MVQETRASACPLCPVGSYVREFDLDPGLRGKRVCVSFQGVEQALFLWLNGHFVGYAEDSARSQRDGRRDTCSTQNAIPRPETGAGMSPPAPAAAAS